MKEILTIILIILSPFIVYTLFRVASAAVFKSYFDQKITFIKEVGDGSKRAKGTS